MEFIKMNIANNEMKIVYLSGSVCPFPLRDDERRWLVTHSSEETAETGGYMQWVNGLASFDNAKFIFSPSPLQSFINDRLDIFTQPICKD